jgi:8-oxo-dGTP diphosphatase
MAPGAGEDRGRARYPRHFRRVNPSEEVPTSSAPRSVAEIDWDSWRARDPATLVFVVQEGRLLLIRKKRGLGAGKINGPGGRLEPGETARAGAVREVREELCVTPTGLRLAGENRFQFVDGYSIHVFVFAAFGCAGEPLETEEAVPLWTPIAHIPWSEMWEDDRLWLPHLLAGRRFSGRFVFDGDRMLDHALEVAAG